MQLTSSNFDYLVPDRSVCDRRSPSGSFQKKAVEVLPAHDSVPAFVF